MLEHAAPVVVFGGMRIVKGKNRPARQSDAEDEAEVPCTLRFCNQRQGVIARVLWVDDTDEEREYARLDELVRAALCREPRRLAAAATAPIRRQQSAAPPAGACLTASVPTLLVCSASTTRRPT